MKSVVVSFAILLTASIALAQSQNPESDFANGRWAGWAFQEENDVLAPTNTDKYYTQGLRFSMTRNPAKNPEPIEKLAGFLNSRLGNRNVAEIWTIGIGQNIYTPDDVTIATPQLNDRHWGAFLYIDNMIQLVDKTEDEQGFGEKFRHVVEMQVGVVGPAAGGRFAQSKVHEIIDSAPPVGWPNQLKNELGLNIIYAYDRRIAREFGPLDVDLQPHIGGSLGTVMTYADVGAIVRVGKNNTGFLNGAMRATAFTQFSGNRPRWEFWVYGGAQGRAVAHNIFLSGGFLEQIPTEIETKRFVYDVMTGFSLRYRRWRLTYNLTRRSSEFSHPFAADDGKQVFGSVVLSVERIIRP